VTGVLLNLPTTLYLLRRAFREHYISTRRFRVAATAVPLGTIALLPLLFMVGKQVTKRFEQYS